MLTSLLPGLRELRAPLAAGFLWILAGWLAIASHIPSPERATGIFKDIYRLGEAVGRPGVLAALSFAAYLLGILTEQFTYLLVKAALKFWRSGTVDRVMIPVYEAINDVLIERHRKFEGFRNQVQERLSLDDLYDIATKIPHESIEELVESIEGLVEQSTPGSSRQGSDQTLSKRLSNSQKRELRRSMSDLIERDEKATNLALIRVVDYDAYAKLLRSDLDLVPARLVGKEQEVYMRWDQLRAESDFRLSITLPLFVLFTVLAVRLNPALILFILVCGYLLHQGLKKRGEAAIQLAETIRAERVLSPPLEHVKEGEPRWSRGKTYPVAEDAATRNRTAAPP
jgi:hypothetical protein